MEPNRLGAATDPSPTAASVSSITGTASRMAVDRLSFLCDQLVDRWRKEGPVPVEQFLAAHPEVEPGGEDEFELIFTEYLLGEEFDLTPSLEGYLDRFPLQAGRLRRQLTLHHLLDDDDSLVEADDPTPEHEPLAAPSAGRGRWYPAPAGYQIERMLGRGGMGVVYQARQVRLNRVIALKMIRSGAYATAEDASRFRAEAEVIAQFQHPHIVQIYAMGDFDGQPFFEMEYVDGGSLAERLDGTPRPVREAAGLLEVVARTMHEAHRRGIVHRDLKPANILMTLGGSPKIADFGLAKLLDVDSGLTRTDSVLGSPGYMAPEQAGGAKQVIGPAADVYAMGVILYELITGRPPFTAPSVLETLDLVRHAEPVPPSRLRPGLPRDAETIALRCLAKEPVRRYPSAEALADDLACFLAGRPILARPVGMAERAWRWARRNAALAGLIAAVTASLVGGFAGMAVLWSRAVHEARNTELARRAELASRAEIDRISTALSLDRGLTLAEGGQVARGLHFMADALRIDPADRIGLGAATRRNLSAWTRQMPRLVAAADLPEGTTLGQFSPDGRFYAAPSRAGAIRIWNLDTLRPVDLVASQGGHVRGVTFRGVENVLASWGADEAVRFWDAATGRPVGSPLVHPARVYYSTSNADGRRIAALCESDVWIWDPNRPERPIGRINSGDGVSRVMFVPNDPREVITIRGKQIQRWDTATRSPLGPPMVFDSWVYEAVFSPDGSQLVVGFGDVRRGNDPTSTQGGAKLFDTGTWQPVGSVLSHNSTVAHIGFRADSRTFLTSDSLGTTRQWDRDGRSLGAPVQVELALNRPSFSPDGQSVLLGSSTGRARLWDMNQARPISATIERQGEVLASFHRNGRSIVIADARQVAIYDVDLADQPPLMLHRRTSSFMFRDDRSLLTGGQDGTARLWDVTTAQPLVPAMKHRGWVDCLDVSPGGAMVATGGRDDTVRLWDRAGNPIGRPILAPHWVRALKLVNGGRQVLVGSADNSTRLLNTSDGTLVGTPIQHNGRTPGHEVDFFAVTVDGDTAISFSNEGTIARMDLRSGRQVGEIIVCSWRPSDVFVNRNATRLITLSGGVAHVIDVDEGRLVRWFGHSLNAGTFFADGRTILVGGSDRLVRRWDVETGQPVGPPLDVGRPVGSVTIGPDERIALIITSDGQGRFWDLPSGQPIGRSRSCWLPQNSDEPKFSADGRRVAVYHDSVEIWDVPAPWPGAYEQIRGDLISTIRIDVGDRAEGEAAVRAEVVPDSMTNRVDTLPEREAIACLLQDNPSGALWHLDRASPAQSETWFHHALRAEAALLRNDDPMIAAELAEVHRRATPEQALVWDANFAVDAMGVGRWDLAVAALDQYLARRSDNLIMTAERGWARARVGDWVGARLDIGRAFDDQKFDFDPTYNRCLLMRMAGDLATYRSLCEQLLADRAGPLPQGNPRMEHLTGRLVVACPDALANYDLPLQWLGPDAKPTEGGVSRYNPAVYGALLYRSGRPEEAVPFLRRSGPEVSPDDAARCWPFLAMIDARHGRYAEARRRLDRLQAQCAESRRSPERFWSDLDLMILLEEAKAVVLDAAWPEESFAP